MAKKVKYSFRSTRIWKTILIVGLSVLLLIGAIFGISALSKETEKTTKTINPSYAIGGLTEQGTYLETTESIYTKDAFECQGLNVKLAFDNNISYRIFFYDFDDNFVNATEKLTANYSEKIDVLVKTARIVITPNEDGKISWYEKGGYAKQLSISVDKEQKSTLTLVDITNSFVFVSGKALIANAEESGFGTLFESTVFKVSNYVDISRYTGCKLSITMPVYTTSSSGRANYGLAFFNANEDVLETNATYMKKGANSVELLEIVIPANAKYVRTTYYSDSYTNYSYDGEFVANIIL